MGVRARDSQRSRWWKAFYESIGNSENYSGKPMPLPDVQRVVNRIMNSKRFLKKYPQPTTRSITVLDGISRGPVGHTIRIRKRERVLPYIAVHLAWGLLRSNYNWRTEPYHGWRFASIVLDLVTWTMGSEKAALLKAAYKSNKVKFRPPRKMTKKTISPAAKEALERYQQQERERKEHELMRYDDE